MEVEPICQDDGRLTVLLRWYDDVTLPEKTLRDHILQCVRWKLNHQRLKPQLVMKTDFQSRFVLWKATLALKLNARVNVNAANDTACEFFGGVGLVNRLFIDYHHPGIQRYVGLRALKPSVVEILVDLTRSNDDSLFVSLLEDAIMWSLDKKTCLEMRIDGRPGLFHNDVSVHVSDRVARTFEQLTHIEKLTFEDAFNVLQRLCMHLIPYQLSQRRCDHIIFSTFGSADPPVLDAIYRFLSGFGELSVLEVTFNDVSCFTSARVQRWLKNVRGLKRVIFTVPGLHMLTHNVLIDLQKQLFKRAGFWCRIEQSTPPKFILMRRN